MDNIFLEEDSPEQFDLEKELRKLDIKNIEIKKGDVWQFGDSRLMCGDSTIESEMQPQWSGLGHVHFGNERILSFLVLPTIEESGHRA